MTTPTAIHHASMGHAIVGGKHVYYDAFNTVGAALRMGKTVFKNQWVVTHPAIPFVISTNYRNATRIEKAGGTIVGY